MSGISKEAVIGVVGAGAMGAGIAQVAAAAGHPVLLFDVQPGAAEKALGKIASDLARLVEKGKFTAEYRDDLLARITVCSQLEELAPSQLVIEAIVENVQVKRDLFQKLEALVSPEAILTSNTSSLSITEIAAALAKPERFAGLHFFNPAPTMPLVEVVSGLQTSPSVAQALFVTATAWGKQPVHVRNSPGFIVNRGARAFYGEALRVLEEHGADAPTIDALLRANGFRLGPLELIDLVGLDINLAASRGIFDAHYGDPRYKPSALVQEMVSAGRLGRKTKSGFYEYGDAPKPEPKVLPESPAPKEITIHGDLGPAEALAPMWEAAGIIVKRAEGDAGISAGVMQLKLTNGGFADANAIHFDLSLDYPNCPLIALAVGEKTPPEAIALATGLFQAIGKQVVRVQDLPGMVVARTICMLVNEAAESLHRGLSSAAEIDRAMTLGLNFPGGPLAWCDRLGAKYVLEVLDDMAALYGEERYRANILLRRMAMNQTKFHE
ncbi:MAG: 3-hydroxyacyl-CoA dehydrogenase [Armatimonadetes bacterium]|nr:3-hydroxyacyl-CoA dehydrogenase [Armatimonadota bacterium]